MAKTSGALFRMVLAVLVVTLANINEVTARRLFTPPVCGTLGWRARSCGSNSRWATENCCEGYTCLRKWCIPSRTTSEPTISEPTTSEPTTSEPTTSEPTTSEPTTSEPTTSEPTTSEPTTSEPTTSEPTTSEPTTSEPTTSEPTTSEPTTSEPTTSEPTTSEPTTSEPTTSEPTTSEPTTSEPTTSEPTTSEPTTSEPTTSEPTTSEPTTSEPTTSEPTTSEPTTSEPTTSEPTTSEPTTSEPTTSEPTTSEPTTSEPTTSEPTTSEPTTSEPTTSEPTTSEPTTSEPTTSEPTTSDPTTSEPTTSEPTTSEPTTLEPTTSEPTTSEPTTSEPTTSEPTTSEPTSSEPTTSEPTTSEPTTSELSTSDPTTEEPTMSPTSSPVYAFPFSVPGGVSNLPPSLTEQLLILSKSCSSNPTGIARSFGGSDWVPIPPTPAQIECTAGSCAVTLESGATDYCVREIDTSSVPVTDEAVAARFLSQATFGVTMSNITHLVNILASNFTAWVEEQFNMPASSLRQHYRARANPKSFVGDPFGELRSACEVGSRWNGYTFGTLDDGRNVTVSTNVASNFELSIFGVVLTELASFELSVGEYTVCTITEYNGIGGSVRLSSDGCTTYTTISNPPVQFPSGNINALDFTTASLVPHPSKPDILFLDTTTPACTSVDSSTLTIMTNGSAFFRHDPRLRTLTNTLGDPAEAGADFESCPTVVKTQFNEQFCKKTSGCSAPTFGPAQVRLNDTILRHWFTASNRYVYYVTGFRLEDPYDISFCSSGTSRWLRSQGTCDSTTQFDVITNTLQTVTDALSSSTDSNPYVRDIFLTGENCNASDDNTVGAKVQVGDECFEHVHPNLYDVRDFSYWVLRHDGNGAAEAANRPNPISKWADQGSTNLNFPPNHPMSRWNSRNRYIDFVGRYGDVLDFTALSTDLQTKEMAAFVGATVTPGENVDETCGSPSETENDPFLGHWYPVVGRLSGTFEYSQLDYPMRGSSGKSTVWATVSLQADDQLRQRVAWALSEIVITADSLGRSGEIEPWTVYYDLFVRNAFGNYLDILREASYSVMMGDYLSYRQNRAFANTGNFPDENYAREIMQLFSVGLYKLNQGGERVLDSNGEPIETYTNEDIVAGARLWTGFDRQSPRGNIESASGPDSSNALDPMQIKPEWRDRQPKTVLDSGYLGDEYPLCDELPGQPFLLKGAKYRLTGDTSVEGEKLDEKVELPDEIFEAENPDNTWVAQNAYTNQIRLDNPNDYVEWSFTRAEVETVMLRAYYDHDSNTEYTVQLTVNNIIVDDAWPIPESGSTTKLRSNSPKEIDLIAGTNTIRITILQDFRIDLDFIAFGGDGAVFPRLEVLPSSNLFGHLCAPESTGGPCTFPTSVELPSTLSCVGAQECNAGRVLVVSIVDPSDGKRQYYRHRHVPCTRLAVYDDAHVVKRDGSRTQCTKDSAPRSVACCASSGSTSTIGQDILNHQCLYANEAVPYATALARCAARGGSVCSGTTTMSSHTGITCAEDTFYWTDQACQPQIQIYQGGYVGLIDPVALDTSNMWFYMNNSGNYFGVRWDGSYPTPDVGCGAGCDESISFEGPTCICNITVTETIPFTDTSVPPATIVANTLFIGAVNPLHHGSSSDYIRCAVSSWCSSELKVWTRTSSTGWDRDTIFELPPKRVGGRTRFLLNRLSIVAVDGQPSVTFRNPPTFMPTLGEIELNWETYLSPSLLVDEAEDEVEAQLVFLFEHENTGPFIAKRLIQQMVTSNPAADYVTRVVNAFNTGSFSGFGSGKYGDLGAMVAAILLDTEARTPQLDVDPSFGHGHESLLKVLSIFRSLEWSPNRGQELTLYNTEERLGMEAFSQPTVFGFYSPEYAAAGLFTDKGLVSPEFQLLQTPLIINFLNGIVSTIGRGALSSCSDGFGSYCMDSSAGYQGQLHWSPAPTATAAEIVDELALILNQGRLNDHSRSIIIDAFNAEEDVTDRTHAIELAQKLILTSSEFHTSGVSTITDVPQTPITEIPSQNRAFKAIVVLFQSGGCDSYNLLVPHSQCTNNYDYYNEYREVRTDGARPLDELIEVDLGNNSGQPCDVFGVHHRLPAYKQLFDLREGSFFANIGSLIEPLTKADYQGDSDVPKAKPPSLFAHNAQQEALATLEPQNGAAKGVLARTIQALIEGSDPYKSELFSIAGNQRMLQGSDLVYDIVSRSSGVRSFREYDELSNAIFNMTANISDHYFANTFNKLLRASLQKTEALGTLLEAQSLTADFGDDSLSQQFEQVSKLIKLRDELETERAVFVVERGGFDTHNTWDMDPMFNDMSAGLSSFAAEMRAQGIWDDVVFLTTSDFARTLTSNGQGSDHAWGGNHFIAGGNISGGKMFGHFPDTLAADGDLNIGRGRVIPTSPWEAMWGGVVEWFGVPPDKMNEVLPNIQNFHVDKLYDESELFKPPSDSSTTSSSAASTTHQVIWTVPASPSQLNINTADKVEFNWSGFHDLQETASDTCEFAGATELAPGASGGSFLWTPPGAGTYHFACSIGQHCEGSMKITITVV